MQNSPPSAYIQCTDIQTDMSHHDTAIREKTEHLTPNAPAAGHGYSNDPMARDHYSSNGGYNDLENNNLQRISTGMTLTPEMFERMYLNPKNNVYVNILLDGPGLDVPRVLRANLI